MPRGMPSLRRHATGQAFATIAGRNRYFGAWGSPEAEEAYRRTLAAWVADGRPRAWDGPRDGSGGIGSDGGLLIAELVDRYEEFAAQTYRKRGRVTTEVGIVYAVLDVLVHLYGSTPVSTFGPLDLKRVRQALIDGGIRTAPDKDPRDPVSRDTANRYTQRIVRTFKWGVEEELVPPTVLQALQAVAGLRRGRTKARESEGVLPVPMPHVEAVLEIVRADVADMIRLQLWSGMRPGEACAMRVREIEIADGVWTYRPDEHKVEHHERGREVYLGPRCIKILRPRLSTDLSAWVFPSERKRDRPWTEAGYRRCITRACARAKLPDKSAVPRWAPNQLRHNLATEARRRYGIEAARLLLGHADAGVTEIYAERDRAAAIQIAREIG